MTRRPHLLLVAIALALSCLIRFEPVAAQTISPTSEQLDMLRNLTPEQRDSIMRQIGGGGSSGLGGLSNMLGGSGLNSNRSRDGVDQDDREPRTGIDNELLRRLSQPQEVDDGPLRNGQPILKGDDSVIISIELREAHPTRQQDVVPSQQALTPLQMRGGVAPGAAVDLDNNAAGVNANKTPPRPKAPELTEEERERLEKLVDLIRSRNPYRLTRDGILQLPGFGGIALSGLTALEATVRLQADPALRDLDVNLIRLPLKKIGPEALQAFGYDLFEHSPSTFAPVTNVPVPADYVIGSGDVLEILLYGSQNRSLRLTVTRDGLINFPELGPIGVAGQRFTSVKESIEARVARQMIGVRANVSMGDTRSIRVFVLGEAGRPGSYTISGLGTITSALFAAGGVKPIGSLRKIQLKRQGTLVRTFDLYDMLIRGDSTDDVRLLPGDVVFIPPVGATVTVSGEVLRPAIYEVKNEATLASVVELAGGLTPEADRTKASLTRIDETQQRVVVTASLVPGGGPSINVRNGDLLQISRLRPTLDSGVTVEGHVFAPARYAYRDGLRLSQVIRSVDELKPNADINYLLIRRELPPNREISVVSADLGAALAGPGSVADVLLMPRDRIIVFDLETSRERIIRSLMTELRTQATFSHPTSAVTVDGQVKVPGDYPLEPGMRISDLIRAGGNLSDAAFGESAELTRYRVVNGDSRRTVQIDIDLAAIRRGERAADVLLEPFDSLRVKEMPEWSARGNVMLVGEVRFPGRYSIKQGETLKSVIDRAGGLTEFSFPEGSVFTRRDLREREQKQLNLLADRLQNDLVTLALQGAAANQAGAGTALTVGQSLLSQVRTSEAVGRLVIDLPHTLRAKAGSGADVVLRDGDRLIVPKFQQEVTVIGEVQTATSHLFRPELSRDDYIALSGGLTRRADKELIYVVRADGSVVSQEGGRWFSRNSIDIRPGDTIVAPLDTERMPSLPFWQAVTSIIYNLAISAAAVNSF